MIWWWYHPCTMSYDRVPAVPEDRTKSKYTCSVAIWNPLQALKLNKLPSPFVKNRLYMSGDQHQCYRARRRAACLLWLYAAGAAPPRSPGPWHLQAPTLCHTAALSRFRGTARDLWWRLPTASYHGSRESFIFPRRNNTDLSCLMSIEH